MAHQNDKRFQSTSILATSVPMLISRGLEPESDNFSQQDSINMHPEWNLHYERWVIEDGQPDLAVGEIFKWFAIAFWTESKLVKVDERTKSAVPIEDYKYRVVAEVRYVSEKACIIDFGLTATASVDLLPDECREGDHVRGEIYLNLPLCTDVVPEELFKILAHKWQVNRISADLTPYVASSENPRFLSRDDSRIRYQEVTATRSVRANSYVLHCSEAVELP